MSRVLVTFGRSVPQRWGEAFADGPVVASTDDPAAAAADSLWLDLSATADGEPAASERAARVEAAVTLRRPVVAMTASPTEVDAFALLQAGARGYCHIESAVEQLREIALAVEHGGLWMPPALMQRLLNVSARRAPDAGGVAADPGRLTSRERMVAQAVARGASNREIAEQLQVSERTVKAHLTAIFDKLGLRDRVQLALAMHEIPVHGAED